MTPFILEHGNTHLMTLYGFYRLPKARIVFLGMPIDNDVANTNNCAISLSGFSMSMCSSVIHNAYYILVKEFVLFTNRAARFIEF